ncbi:MAG: PAS domain S-box protein [Deltaproteobacteria bacterium]|nr:PAS domain S-box protein [Deltaproteobacteria bacterium]
MMKLHWEGIFASLGEGLLILDLKERITAINPALERLTGLSSDSFTGKGLADFFGQDSEYTRMIRHALQELRTTTVRELHWLRKDGKKTVFDLSISPRLNEDESQEGWIIAFRDMTRLHQLQEEIRKNDRLAMLGTLAAGLAHEIKNPLSGIKGAAQLLKRENAGSGSVEFLEIIIKETERVDRLVNDLLSLTKPRSMTLQPVNLNQLIDSVVLLERESLGARSIQVSREFDPSMPPVLGDEGELFKVFLNFMKNAVEAIPNGEGHIWLRSRIETNFKIRGEEENRPTHVVVAEIQDNGEGIQKENLDKIFTPLFTTKEKGYGLGLPIAQRIIQEHGGQIRINSERGKGTRVQIYLRSCL